MFVELNTGCLHLIIFIIVENKEIFSEDDQLFLVVYIFIKQVTEFYSLRERLPVGDGPMLVIFRKTPCTFHFIILEIGESMP